MRKHRMDCIGHNQMEVHHVMYAHKQIGFYVPNIANVCVNNNVFKKKLKFLPHQLQF
jgi:hypothetical protein